MATILLLCGNCGASETKDGVQMKRCGRCLTQYYCSTDCQKKHWADHKTTCQENDVKSSGYSKWISSTRSLPAGQLADTGVWITPALTNIPAEPYGCGLTATYPAEVTVRSLQHTPTDLALPQMLGVPLRLLGVNGDDSNIPNPFTALLGLEPDPSSASFGKPRFTNPKGATIVVRKDRKPLHIFYVNALVQFCYMIKKEVGKSNPHQIAARFLNPDAFRRFFNDMKAKEIHDNTRAWAGVECPV